MTDDQRAKANILRWAADPLAFVRENFHVEPDPFQVELLQAFVHPDVRRISLQACAGPGKTAGLSWCGLHFLTCQGDEQEHPKGAAVSVTRDNLRDNLFPELAKWQGQSEFLSRALTWTNGRIFSNDHPETWFISARSWPKGANADTQGKTLSGLHSRYVLALIDECGEIPMTVARAAEQALSTGPKFGRIVISGNPTSLDGMLYEVASTLRDLWTIIRVTGDPEDPKSWVNSPRHMREVDAQGQTPAEWAREQIKAHGRDNPWVMSYILGLFPPGSINALIGIEEVNAAMERHWRRDVYIGSQRRLGVDVARFGDDRTVLFPRQGLRAWVPEEMRVQDTMQIAARVLAWQAKFKQEVTLIDDTGHWGHGVIDGLRSVKMDGVVGVNFGAPAIDKQRYENRRVEGWLNMANAIREGLSLPNVTGLVKELITPTYTFSGGKFRLEHKDMIKKRLGKSPDLADALALTYMLPEMPSKALASVGRPASAITEFDPYETSRGRGSVSDFDPYE